MAHYNLKKVKWNAQYKVSEVVDKKEKIVAYFIEYADAITFCQTQCWWWFSFDDIFDDYINPKGDHTIHSILN